MAHPRQELAFQPAGFGQLLVALGQLLIHIRELDGAFMQRLLCPLSGGNIFDDGDEMQRLPGTVTENGRGCAT
jgi:hypothetical protein